MELLKIIVFTLILHFFYPCEIMAVTDDKTFIVEGNVYDKSTKEKLPFVSVILDGKDKKNIYTQTDKGGRFLIKNIKEGSYELRVNLIGYKKYARRINIQSNKNINIALSSQSYSLGDIVVTASESQGMTSASRINKDAMKHLQPSSFTDLLSLLPGGKVKIPSLTQANTIKLRETGNSGSDYDFSSLGTVFVTDGIPMSTNSNMQVIKQASSRSNGDPDSYRSVANKGVDMRSISTDNIENVEIVRGIASAEYGDLTSGVVIINRKLKATPWEARFKADPYSKLFYLGKGFEVKDRGITLNTSLDYLDAKRDPRTEFENYKRLTGSLRFQKIWNKNDNYVFRWKAAADYTGSFDDDKNDPEILKNKDDRYESSYNRFSFSNSLALNFTNNKIIKSLNFDAAVSYEASKIEQNKLVSIPRDQISSTSLQEGEHDGVFLPYSYMSHVTVDGKPLSAFAKIKGLFSFDTFNVKQRINAGIEWKADKNYGDGQVYDPSRPITPGTPYRPRVYKDIPSQQIASAYIQDNITSFIGQHKLQLNAGLRAASLLNLSDRYDISGKVFLDPRINLKWTFPSINIANKPLTMFISGGIGEQTKFPTLMYLYPDMIYTDIIQLNYFNLNPDFRRVNIRTYKDDPTNYNIQPARNKKWEVRLGASYSGHRLSVTYFREQTKTGFRSSSVVRPYQYKNYDETSIDDSQLHGQPNLNNISFKNDTILDMYSQITNGSRLRKEGIEFQYSSNRIKPIMTRFTINGAWFRTTYSNSQPMFMRATDHVIGDIPVSNKYIGYYDTEDGSVHQSFNTNFMADTYIKKLGLSVSITAECTWFETSRSLKPNGVPKAYMNTKGEILPYTEADKTDMYKQWLIRKFNSAMFKENKIPFYAFFNLKVTKDFGKYMNVALFVDRILDYMPDYETSSGLTVRRIARPYFGIETNITI